MMRVLIDGIFYQRASSGIARVWTSVLTILAQRPDLEIMMLDRGNAPAIPGLLHVPFPNYVDAVATDSHLIQRFCDDHRIDVFSTTYYTTPLRVPMVLMIYDMIPEVLGFDMSVPMWVEKEMAIAYAQRFLCISHCTRNDLLDLYPDIPKDRAEVAWCGLDSTAFTQRPPDEIAAFRARHGLTRDYFIFVGSRIQHHGYKNSQLFFAALRHLTIADFDILCVGGEAVIAEDLRDRLPAGVGIQRVELSDHDLSLAYGGAAALVYPSLYEGFGMPVVEAMASGCPVITTARGSLAEVAGDAALLVGGTSVAEMAEALLRVRDPVVQTELRARGLKRAGLFNWESMADLLHRQFGMVLDEGRSGARDAFFADWERLRRIQADVEG